MQDDELTTSREPTNKADHSASNVQAHGFHGGERNAR